MTAKRAQWLGETLRLYMTLGSYERGDRGVSIRIVRDYLMQASDADICAKFLLPALRALKRAHGIPSPRLPKRTASK